MSTAFYIEPAFFKDQAKESLQSNNTLADPINVTEFVERYMKTIKVAAGTDVKAMEEFQLAWYNIACVNGQKFKNAVPVHNSKAPMPGSKAEGLLGAGFKSKAATVPIKGYPIYIALELKNTLICAVVRGSDDGKIVVRPEIVNSDDGKSKYMIMTPKLLQAVISVTCAIGNFQAGLATSRLSVAEFSSYKGEEAKSDQQNWLIHAHAGINFVAKYLYQLYEKDEKKYKETLDEQNLPPIWCILNIAAIFDENRNNRDDEGKLKTPTLRAIMQTTQMSKEVAEHFSSLITEDEWGASALRRSEQVAEAFRSNLKRIKEAPEVKKADGGPKKKKGF